MKGEVRAAKRASPSKTVRKGLSDITNSPLVSQKVSSKDPAEPVLVSSEITKDYVDKLIQENRTLVKLIEERNKIIELSGAELQRLRISYQKTQLQNWNLAQSNSQMLAELNLSRDKLKALQHELACKEVLLKAKKLEVQGKLVDVDKHVVKNDSMEGGEEEKAKELANDKQKPPCQNRRTHKRSQSMGVPRTNKQDLDKEKAESKQDSGKEKAENKRRCLRRQSARFVSQEREPAENLLETEEAKLSASRPLKSGPSSSVPSSVKEGEENGAPSRADELEEAHRRSSIVRPLRRAAEKVHSYREPPLNVKMRRAE